MKWKHRMSQQFQVKDSGERRNFDTGAKRDVDYNKPRFDLIPTTVLQKIIQCRDQFKQPISDRIDDDIKAEIWNLGLAWSITIDDDFLLRLIWLVLDIICLQEKDNLLSSNPKWYGGFHRISPKTYLRLANHYGKGAQKYDAWNWSKGMPLSVFYASLMRHIFAIVQDETEEDHLSAIFFNAACILHFRIIKRDDVDDITPRITEWRNTQSRTPKNDIDIDVELKRIQSETSS